VYKSVLENNGLSAKDVLGIGIANQRETVVIWDKLTGKPISNAIVWQCRRTADLCEELKINGYSEVIKKKTGLVIDAYFSSTKIKWILENIPGAKKRAKKGEILAGTMDTWLIWNLSGGKFHITDYTNASRTMLFNIHTLEWDKELLSLFEIPQNILPDVVPSSGELGYTDPNLTGNSVPITGIAGDQQAALFGQACFSVGSAKNTYGTGCFIMMNTGKDPVISKNNLITTIAWKVEKEKPIYAIEGSVLNGGSTLKWVRDELKMVKHIHEIDLAAEKTSDANGVYIVPAFTGLGAPYWDMYARGTIVGLTRGSNRLHLLRAALESIAYQSRDVFEAMKLDSGVDLKELKVDGGASISDVLMHFQAGILNCRVIRPKILESTAMGAVYLSGLALGIWNNTEDIKANWKLDKEFLPSISDRRRDLLYKGWKKAVNCARGWEE